MRSRRALDDRADARQRDPRHQQVERDEGDHEPEQLRREGLLSNGGKPAPCSLAGNARRPIGCALFCAIANS